MCQLGSRWRRHRTRPGCCQQRCPPGPPPSAPRPPVEPWPMQPRTRIRPRRSAGVTASECWPESVSFVAMHGVGSSGAGSFPIRSPPRCPPRVWAGSRTRIIRPTPIRSQGYIYLAYDLSLGKFLAWLKLWEFIKKELGGLAISFCTGNQLW